MAYNRQQQQYNGAFLWFSDSENENRPVFNGNGHYEDEDFRVSVFLNKLIKEDYAEDAEVIMGYLEDIQNILDGISEDAGKKVPLFSAAFSEMTQGNRGGGNRGGGRSSGSRGKSGGARSSSRGGGRKSSGSSSKRATRSNDHDDSDWAS